MALRKTVDAVTKHLRALKKLNQPVDSWDTLIIFTISAKLDPKTAREWKEKRSNYESPSLDNFYTFLKDRVVLFE